MKHITLNIPNDYADVLCVTVVGGAGTKMMNVKTAAYDLTDTKDSKEIDIEVVDVEKVCECFDTRFGYPVCNGTKERERCTCNGNKRKCNFY